MRITASENLGHNIQFLICEGFVSSPWREQWLLFCLVYCFTNYFRYPNELPAPTMTCFVQILPPISASAPFSKGLCRSNGTATTGKSAALRTFALDFLFSSWIGCPLAKWSLRRSMRDDVTCSESNSSMEIGSLECEIRTASDDLGRAFWLFVRFAVAFG